MQIPASIKDGSVWCFCKEKAKSFNYTGMLTSCWAACWLGTLQTTVSSECVCVCVSGGALGKQVLHWTRGNGDNTPERLVQCLQDFCGGNTLCMLITRQQSDNIEIHECVETSGCNMTI